MSGDGYLRRRCKQHLSPEAKARVRAFKKKHGLPIDPRTAGGGERSLLAMKIGMDKGIRKSHGNLPTPSLPRVKFLEDEEDQ
jgi:hypothetical protein